MSPRTLSAFCEVLDTMVGWLDAAEVEHNGELAALSALRLSIAVPSDSTVSATNTACSAIYPAEAVVGPRRDLRGAILLLALAALTPPTKEQLDICQRMMLAYAANVGIAVGVKDAARLARLALDRGQAEGRQASRFPEPGFARSLALGCVIAHLREQGKLSAVDLCRLAGERGCRMTVRNLGRLEGGNAWKDAPVDELAACFGQSPAELRARATAAHDLALKIMGTFGIAPSERWFAEVVALYGEKAARSAISLAAVGAVKLPKERLGVR